MRSAGERHDRPVRGWARLSGGSAETVVPAGAEVAREEVVTEAVCVG